jgi:MGT family glycosyltransferase
MAAPFSSERLTRLAAATERELASLMQTFGKQPLSLEALVSQVEDLTLMFVPKEFQHESEAFDNRFLFVGPSFIEAAPEPWPFETDAVSKHRRAYVSLGTLRNDDPEFYRACYSALPPDEWQVVMSVGEQVDLSVLKPVPVNFRVARSVRQTAILPQVDLFITHGGLNSVMESLSFGVPMIVIPSIKEQVLTAERVGALGCGLVLDRGTVTPSSLKEHASAVVNDNTMKSRLGKMRQSIVTGGGYRRAADALVRYTRAQRSDERKAENFPIR